MRKKWLLALLLVNALAAAPAGAGYAQNKQGQCEQGPRTERNWEVLGGRYVFFDYTLCPADTKNANPLVRVWITTDGNGIAVEKWAADRDGADVVSMFHGKKKVFTLYRDLKAIPLKIFKAESRANVPADTGARPFWSEGSNLVPFENLTPESAERAKKVFESADLVVKSAQAKVQLIRESQRIGIIVDALDRPLKAQN